MRYTTFAVMLATAAANKELDKAIEDNNAAMVNLALKSGAKANSVDDDNRKSYNRRWPKFPRILKRQLAQRQLGR